jgi:acetyl-CoA carboxylase carboxyltransferase component
MSRLDKINELVEAMNEAKSTARERIEKLFDENTFVEIGALRKEAGVVTGHGTIGDKLVYAYSQEAAVDAAQAEKITKIYELALKTGCPVISIMDSKGLKLDNGLEAFKAYGLMFRNQTKASGVIPQISIVLGDCIGVSSFTPALSDMVIATEESAKMFMTSPAVFQGLEGKATTYDSLGGGKVLGANGLAHITCKNEDECFEQARRMISFFPENNLETAISYSLDEDELNAVDEALNTIIPEDNETPIDVQYIIKSVADRNDFMEVHKNYAPEIITGFVRFNGITTGIVANNGKLTVEATQKAADFVNGCDAFNIPIVTFTDIAGYEQTLEQEKLGIISNSAKLLFSFANATVPKINIVLRNAVGNPYLLMNSKHIGADMVYAWPSAFITLLPRKAAVDIIGFSAEEFDKITTPIDAASKGYVDTVIIPSNTRKRILVSLETLMSKRELNPTRKHASAVF